MNKYKACILAAGVGKKMGSLSEGINIALLPVNFKASISYAVEKFPKDIEIVVAVGHKKETVINYLTLAHPERNFTFVEVDKYMGPGSGPGYSLLQCREQLQCPFVFAVADLIILEDIPAPDKNWFGIAPVKKTEEYCTVKIKNNLIFQLDDKTKNDNKFAFLGYAGVYDYEVFFDALEKNKEIKSGEVQVSNGFSSLIEKKLVPTSFTWFDTGSLKNYIETNKNFSGNTEDFDFSKGDEFLYFVGDRIIKFFANEEIARKRSERAEYLKGLCPEIEGHRGNFYSYKRVKGHDLHHVMNSKIIKDLLKWSKNSLWEKQDLSESELEEFRKACRSFYYDKTMKRLDMFYAKNNITDQENSVNGVIVPPLKDLLAKIDFNKICEGNPVRFHGDFTVGNILVDWDASTQMNKFILLDWRQDFGGLTKVGDVYYDLAKLYKGIILPDDLIKKGMFSFEMSGSQVHFDYFLKSKSLEAKEEFESFVLENGFDLKKIKTITGVALLNMSPLHHEPFNFLVYYMGKNLLHKTLNKEMGL